MTTSILKTWVPIFLQRGEVIWSRQRFFLTSVSKTLQIAHVVLEPRCADNLHTSKHGLINTSQRRFVIVFSWYFTGFVCFRNKFPLNERSASEHQARDMSFTIFPMVTSLKTIVSYDHVIISLLCIKAFKKTHNKKHMEPYILLRPYDACVRNKKWVEDIMYSYP